MESIGTRLRKIRGSKNQTDFAGLLGVSLRAYGQYEKDVYPPSGELLINIRQKLNVSVDWLVSGIGQPEAGSVEGGFSLIPYFSQPASAGQGALIEDQSIAKFLAFRTEWLHNELSAQIRDLFVMRVTGDSMESPSGEHGRRQLRSGDLILVDRGYTNLAPNQIYVISVGEDLYVKAYRRNVNPEFIEFYSFNPAYTPLVFNQKNLRLLHVEGRVCWVARTII